MVSQWFGDMFAQLIWDINSDHLGKYSLYAVSLTTSLGSSLTRNPSWIGRELVMDGC